MTKKRPELKPGHFYAVTEKGLDLEPVEMPPGTVPLAIICRRVIDYPPGTVPAAAAFGVCVMCAEPIAFNPRNQPGGAPKICNRCAGLVL